MLPNVLDELARDIEAGREASTRLKKVLKLSEKGISRAHQLELITRVLDHVCKSDSTAAENAFRVALGSLRALVPFLRKKKATITDTIAAVEKYTVNFALSSSSQNAKHSTPSYREDELSNALQKIFSSRAETLKAKTDTKKVSRRRNVQRIHDKENEDPHQNIYDAASRENELMDQLFFPQAAKTFGLHMLLPNEDSVDVANTIVGALAIRLTRCCEDMCLSDILPLTERAVLPWLNYIRCFDDTKSQRTYTAYLKRVSCYLFDQCRKSQNDPAVVLRTRLFALQIENSKLNQFVANLLQCVKNFTSGQKEGKNSPYVLDTIGSAYESALRYVAKFDPSDRRWISEDVSAWLDHVALIWAKRKPRESIPHPFALRLSSFRKESSKKTLLECFKLQNDLFANGAYELDAKNALLQDSQLRKQTLWKKVASALKSISVGDLLDVEERKLFLSRSAEFSDWRVAEADGLRCLRLMRTLEPLRCFVAAVSRKNVLPQGAEMMLRTYINALFRGLCVLSWPVMSTNSTGASAIDDVLLHLNKMVGGAIEATRDLICSYAHQRLLRPLEDVCSIAAKILQHYENCSPSSSLSWTEWLFNIMTSVSKRVFLEHTAKQAEAEEYILRFSEATMVSADELLNYSRTTVSCSQGYLTLQKTLRDGLLSHRLLWEAADVSLRLFAQVTSSETEGQAHVITSQAGRMVAQDLVRLARNGYSLTFFEDLDVPTDKLLSAFVEYSWWARKHCNTFKTFSRYLETSDGLAVLRRSVFQFRDMSGLVCPVRRTHEEWLCFLHALSRKKSSKTRKIWKSVKSKACAGHYTLGLAEPSAGCISCTTLVSQVLENLRKACEVTALGSFGSVSKFLNTMESVFTANKDLVRHLELITIAVEALQWISTVLAFNSFGVLADQALGLARQCASFFNISPICETLKVCRLLDSLPRLDPHQGEDLEIPSAKKSRKERVPCDSDSSQALQKAKAELKNSLRALWKFKQGSNEDAPQSYSIAGLSVDFSFDVVSMSGQHRLCLVLELLRYLFVLATLQADIENLSEGRYYMELCSQVSVTCFPIQNNSFRRIASMSRANCMTRMDSRTAVQDSVIEHVPLETEDMQDGRDVYSSFSTLQTIADAMLYVEMAWKTESRVSSKTNDTHADYISAMYERCRRILDNGRRSKMPCSDLDTERSRLTLNLGLTYLLNGDQETAIKLIKPLSDVDNVQKEDISAAASYQVARLSMYQAGGLRACLSDSSGQSEPKRHLPPRRGSRRRPRANFGKREAAADEPRAALSRAVRDLVPCLGNFPLCRNVWNMAAMVERDPEIMASRLEKTVGLSFNARYEHNMRYKIMNRTESVLSETDAGGTCILEKQLQNLTLDDSEERDNQSDAKDIMAAMPRGNSILVGVHMNEDKSCFVVWRRCALGLQLKRLWLPSSGSQSYDGMLQRIDSILSEMKESSIRDGQEMSRNEKVSWWEERYRLDERMKLVLTEIQQVWFGPAINLLIPSLVSDSEDVGRDFESYVELGERACDASDHEVVLGNLILLVDRQSEPVPWESLPLLRENEVSATRAPSVSFLASMWNPDRQFDHRNVYYIVNPDGNLGRTEERFRSKLKRRHEWSGITGQTSTESVCESYEGEEIYLYCGHGAGENFFSPSRLCLNTMAPIALLMGCSSCRPRDLEIGDFESNGPAIEFLVHGSPAVVGNLWDVSDGELDRLTASILSLWLGDDHDDGETMSLADAVAQSRSKCRLPYLVGAACIVMGAPDIHAQRHAGN